MKTTLFVLLILCTVSAVGQAGVGVTSGQPSMLEMSGHPEHATQHDLATEQSLLGTASPYSFAQGERPLWEFGPASQPTPLGDIARAYRKEKQAAKKAEFVFEKQGS